MKYTKWMHDLRAMHIASLIYEGWHKYKNDPNIGRLMAEELVIESKDSGLVVRDWNAVMPYSFDEVYIAWLTAIRRYRYRSWLHRFIIDVFS